MRNEVIIARSQRNFYDHAIRSTGITLVEVGIADRFSGAGVRDPEAWEIADAVTDRTAAVCYVAYPHALPPLPEVVEVAHAKGIPVIVDAAGQLPPASNLRRFIGEGADLVTFSGGKAIRGPQSSGILCGRRDLIMAAALQHLDQDILFEQWAPPPALIEKDRLPGAPQHGIGRPCKVGKEEIVGLLAALRLFIEEDEEARHKRWQTLTGELVSALQGMPHTDVSAVVDRKRTGVPTVRLVLDEKALGVSALELVIRLQNGRPSIHANPSLVSEGVVLFGPMCLKEGEPEIIGRHVCEVLKAQACIE
jgi:L-seryl-tRNA(Ser) seleniumtransferase